MNFYEHCNLCVNHKSNLKNGLICGLTNKKPAFNTTCSKIRLSEEFKRQLSLTHIKIERLKKRTTSVYIYFLLATVVGCFLIINQGYLLADFDITGRRYRRSTLPIFLILLGFAMISFAFIKLINHRKKSKAVLDDRDKINAILDKYQIKYNCHVKFGKKYLGNQDVTVELKSNSNLLEASRVTFQI